MKILTDIYRTVQGRMACLAVMAAAAVMASCAKTEVVYDGSASEIGFTPVSVPVAKSLPGPAEGPSFDEFETFGIFAWHKITDAPQTWAAFWADGAEGPGVKYIDGEPFAKLGQYWAGGYNDLDVSFTRGTGDLVRNVTMNVSLSDKGNTHLPKFWPKTGYLAFAGWSPYFKFEAETEEYRDEDGDTKTRYNYYTSRTPLANDTDGTTVSYNTDNPAHPYLHITGFRQGLFDWEHNNHWATNETCDLMWFDADERYTENLGISDSRTAVPVTFHHACAWLDFHFRAEDETADRKFVILKATLSNMYWSGDFRSDNGAGKAEWNSLGDDLKNPSTPVPEIVLYYNLGKKGSSDAAEEFNFITAENYLEVDDLMIIPQSVNKGNGTASVLTIYYKQLTSDTPYEPVENYGEDEDPDNFLFSGKPMTEVYTCELPASDGGIWEMGKHYIYDIVFGLDEIRVSPEILDWKETDTTVNTD